MDFKQALPQTQWVTCYSDVVVGGMECNASLPGSDKLCPNNCVKTLMYFLEQFFFLTS